MGRVTIFVAFLTSFMQLSVAWADNDILSEEFLKQLNASEVAVVSKLPIHRNSKMPNRPGVPAAKIYGTRDFLAKIYLVYKADVKTLREILEQEPANNTETANKHSEIPAKVHTSHKANDVSEFLERQYKKDKLKSRVSLCRDTLDDLVEESGLEQLDNELGMSLSDLHRVLN